MPMLTLHVCNIQIKLHAHLIQLLVLPQLLLLVLLLKLVNANGIAKHQQELLHQLLHAQLLELQ